MKKYALTVYNKNGTHSIHNVSTLKYAQQLQTQWMKDNDVLCAAIYKKVEEGKRK